MSTQLDHLQALAKVKGADLTDDAVAVASGVVADVTDTTPVPLIALTTGKELVITQLILLNKTAAETPIIVLEDTDAAALGTFPLGVGAADDGKFKTDLHPPIVVAVGKGISAKASSATGDTQVSVRGFLQTPAS